MGKLRNKVSIITGAARGIGRAAAKLFAEEGSAVVVADLKEIDGQKVVDEMNEKGGRALFIPTDVANENDVKHLVEKTVGHFGQLDIMYNNAGYQYVKEAHALSKEEWERQIKINLDGVFLGCKYAIQHFLKSGKGIILNTSSINGILPSFKRPAYNAAKAGVILLTKNIAADYGPKNIRANVICPGATYTDMTVPYLEDPDIHNQTCRFSVFNRLAEPEEIARPALFLVSDDASYITGIALQVDGGMNLGGFWL